MPSQLYLYLRRNLLGLLAVFISLGGVSWAATQLPKNSVGSKQIRNGQVMSKDLRDGEVKGRDLGNNAVTSAKVSENSLNGSDINEASLALPPTAAGLTGLAGGDLTGQYPNPTIAVGAVDAAKVLDDSLGGAEIAESNLDNSVLQSRVTGSCGLGEAVQSVGESGAVTCGAGFAGPPTGPAGGELAGNYPNPTIATGAITGGTGGEISDETITAADVLNDSLTSSDIFDNTLIGTDILESSLDNTVLQSRITGTCSSGSALASIAQAGTVVCNLFPTSLPPSGAAGGDLTGTFPSPTITADAVGAAEITDTTRSVNLPLDAFLNCESSSAGLIDFNSILDSAPDFENPADNRLAMQWDVDALFNDTDEVCSTFVVPADYASGGTVRLVSTGGAAQDNDWAVATVRQTAGATVDTTASTAAGGTNCDSGVTVTNIYVCSTTVTDTLSAGDGIIVSVRRAGGTNTMVLHGVEFRYTATQ